ncbi:hypothetical protein P154DRAFT_467308, partial [Amniculicola lignicola CBS 123094]
MARKGGNATQRLAQLSVMNGHPPPSTIAAQIVNNASNINAQQEPGSKAAFGQLLQEYLQDTTTDEPNSQLNAQLISVIAEAGLDALLQDNPFASDLLIPQARDSIAAIKLTIQRRPMLLLSPKDEGDDGIPRPLLFTWLFPKLLGLLGQPQFDTVQEDVKDLLGTFFDVLSRTFGLWRQAKAIVQSYRSCVDSIVLGLEGVNELSQLTRSPFKIALPPSSSISTLWPDSQNHVALPQGTQRLINSLSEAILIGLQLLQVIVNVEKSSGSTGSSFSASENHQVWVLEHCTTLWRKFQHSSLNCDNGRNQDAVQSTYMQLLCELGGLGEAPVQAPALFQTAKSAVSISSSLAELLHLCSESPFSQSNQIQLATIITRVCGSLQAAEDQDTKTGRRSRSLESIVTGTLKPVTTCICTDVLVLSTLERDLQLALCLWTSPGTWPTEVEELRATLCNDALGSFSNDALQQEATSFIETFKNLNFSVNERPSKRRRTIHPLKKREPLIAELLRILSDELEPGFHGLHNTIQDKYLNSSEDERCEMISACGLMACCSTGSLEFTSTLNSEGESKTCALCDCPNSSDQRSHALWDDHCEDWRHITSALMLITELEEFRESEKPRIMMALAIRRIYNHLSDAGALDLNICSLGQWLLGSMSRSLRELRIAAAHGIMVFLRDDAPKSVRGKNRMSTLEFLHTLSQRDNFSEQETIIMAYGLAARVCGEDELPIILLELVEYLGHTNALICGMAYNELTSIAEALDTKPVELLRPFWRSIGFSVIKDLHTKPQKAQYLSDLIEQSVTNMLLNTQAETLPNLVLTKRVDIIERIATSRQISVLDVFLQPRKNLAGILSLLLCQGATDIEKNVTDILVGISPVFHESGNNLSSLVQHDPVLIACEILKSTADQHESKKVNHQRGFVALATLAQMRNGHKKTPSKKKTLSSFFEAHILGIMAHFSDVLDNPLANHPLQERKRCVGAIGEMIGLAGSYASFALPQLRACLQTAMADDNLCDQTLYVWAALLEVLEEEDLELVIDQTFALIAQNWDCFSSETQLKATEAIGSLIKKHDALLRARVDYIPSLASIPLLSKIDGEISRLKAKLDKSQLFTTFSRRCNHENAVVVRQTLKELVPFLEANQKILHDAAVSQKPLPALPALSRSLLDASVRFAEDHADIPVLCAECLGLIGGLDPYRIETVRETKQIMVLSNFERADEVIDFAAFFLERILVKVFHSTTNARSQGFLAYVMQELLRFCGFNQAAVQRPRSSQSSPSMQRWNEIPDAVRSTLTPFLSSKYMIRTNFSKKDVQGYPIFRQDVTHSGWLRAFVWDLLQKGKGVNTKMIFPVLSRIIRGHDLSIATFILPYAVLNSVITGEEVDTQNVRQELLDVLEAELGSGESPDNTHIKQCSENVFQVLDYLSLWLQEKRKTVADARAMAGKTGRGISEMDEIQSISAISCVESVLQKIPAEVISRRAVECGSYARALFHWEQYYRQEQAKTETTGGLFAKDEMLQHLQFIYAQIDEPDSIEGISVHLHVLNPEQQIMEHRKAGRWTAAQSWYELSLAEKPNDAETQINLLTCLKESGQYDSILNYVDGFNAANSLTPSVLPFAAEAAWSTGKWEQLERILVSSSKPQCSSTLDFNVGVGQAMLALRKKNTDEFKQTIQTLREAVAKGLSPTSTISLHACHDSLVKLHVLYEIEAISGISTDTSKDREVILQNLDRRLDILGAYVSDKQYLLGVRRAVMQLSSIEFKKLDIASAWLTTARLARKAEFTPTAFNSILHASQLGDDASKIEYSKLMWKGGHHRKAIQNLQGAITTNAFQTSEDVSVHTSMSVTTAVGGAPNKVKSHAQLLLAKWLDQAGQTKALALRDAYASGLMAFPRWDKGHYYLGRHYYKLLESEKKLPLSKQSKAYLAGETAKHVIENYIRSVVYGTKYYYQTVPKVITLWLDLGMEVMQSNSRNSADKDIYDYKVQHLDQINRHIKRYTTDRMPAFAWYTAFPQLITRISHPHTSVWEVLQFIILKVAAQYPQQALWSLLAVTRATQSDRRSRGTTVLQKLRSEQPKRKGLNIDLKNLIVHGQRLTDALLSACDAPVEQRVSHVSLSKDLGFKLTLAPCLLVVPVEATMLANLPTGNDSRAIRNHNPFPQDAVTIASFADDVLVLSSLQRPRKVNVRGSDGRSYGLLCKPKDDLRKDQRLMEFNAMINRALQRDIESSKRRLYIKTYGVTPLNEECGTIEWVEGLKPMRDIIINLYRQKNIRIDYAELRLLLNEASSDTSKTPIFTHKILASFPPVLHLWFVETFPDPSAWFAARLRYTRSCAVMSIVGHVLGLGDRHGENVLLEEGNGGTFHVDFNCLFDKGLTFEKPELVPFRLTHNMTDAMGPSAIEGPFRVSAERTYALLRQHKETLMTILETFVHDPTADFVGGAPGARKKKKVGGVPETPKEVLESVGGKVEGFLRGESVPLSVEGYVDALCEMARDPRFLCAMYIGWCAFF